MIFITLGFVTYVGGVEIVMDHPLTVDVSHEAGEGFGERAVEITLLVEAIFYGAHIGVFTDVIRFAHEPDSRSYLDIGDGARCGDIVEA